MSDEKQVRCTRCRVMVAYAETKHYAITVTDIKDDPDYRECIDWNACQKREKAKRKS